MKKIFLSILIAGCFFTAVAQSASYTKNADGITVYPADKNIKAVQLKVVSNSIIQVLSSLNKIIQPDTSFIIVANRQK